MMKNKFVHLNHCKSSYCDSGSSKPAIVFLHGLGATKRIFHRQYDSALTQSYRLIGLDLPGHGESDKPSDPETQYTAQALSASVINLLNTLDIERAMVVGWSLGGHIAIEMMQMAPERLDGVFLTGTPILGHGPLAALRGYQLRMELLTALKDTMRAREADKFARLCFGNVFDDARLLDVMRTDMRIRPHFNGSIAQGTGSSQKAIVESCSVPLCLANGADDPFIRAKHFDEVSYANLWEAQTHTIADSGHVPFLTAANAFNMLVHKFAADAVLRSSEAPAEDLRQFA